MRVPLLLLFLSLSVGAVCQQLMLRELSFSALPGNTELTRGRQDASGLMWIASNKGLYRYDGSQLHPVSLPALKNPDELSHLSLSSDGKLLVGSVNGKVWCQLKPGRDDFHLDSISSRTSGHRITGIYSSASDLIAAATYGAGLFIRSGNNFSHHGDTTLLASNDCYVLCPISADEFWVGSDAGITRFGTSWPVRARGKIKSTEGLKDDLVFCIVPAGTGRIAVGTHSGGVQLWDIKSASFFDQEFPGTGQHAVRSIRFFGKECLIALEDAGLHRYAEDGRHLARESERSVTSLFSDREDNIWVFSRGNPVLFASLRLSQYRLEFLKEQEKRVLALLNIGDEIWLSSADGLFRLRNGTAAPMIREEGLRFICLYHDRQGYIWAGTFDKGVFRIDARTGKYTRFTEKDGLVNNNVLSVHGQGDTIWFATLGGLSSCSISGAQVRFFNSNLQKQVGQVYIYSIFADSEGKLWIGTDGKGLACYDKELKWYREPFRHGAIYTIAEDWKGHIWIGTSTSGAWELRHGSFARRTEEEGEVTHIRRAGHDMMAVMHQNRLELYFSEDSVSLSFGEGSGFFFGPPDINALCNEGSRFWIPGENGLIRLDLPETRDKLRPQLLLENVLLYLEPLKEVPSSLSYEDNYLAFDYTGFWYRQPDAVSYRVRLAGLDQEWKETRDTRFIFNDLRPGNYTFEVQAGLYNNFTNASSVSVPFHIDAPWWWKWWFWVLAVLVVAGLGVLFIRIRDARQQELAALEHEKVTFKLETLRSQVNPHFLFNSFNTLQSLIETAPVQASHYVEQLSDFFRHLILLRDKNEIPLKDELALLENYTFLQRQRFGSQFDVRITIPEEYENHHVPPMVLQLLVENALKHNTLSRTEPLIIHVYIDEEKRCLVISNPVRKKFGAVEGTGMGLDNIASRVRLLGNGEMEVNSNEHTFEVRLPLGQQTEHTAG